MFQKKIFSKSDFYPLSKVSDISTSEDFYSIASEIAINPLLSRQFDKSLSGFASAYPRDLNFFLQQLRKFEIQHEQPGKTKRFIKVLELFNEFDQIHLIPKKGIHLLGYGSARTSEDDLSYWHAVLAMTTLISYLKKTEELSWVPNELFMVGSGAGMGKMKAFNYAGLLSLARNYGLKISGGFENYFNEYVQIRIYNKRFDARITGFDDQGDIKIGAVGGVGTLQETSTALALKSLKAIKKPSLLFLLNTPLHEFGKLDVLDGQSRFFDPYHRFIKEKVFKEYGLITEEESNFYQIANSTTSLAAQAVSNKEFLKYLKNKAKNGIQKKEPDLKNPSDPKNVEQLKELVVSFIDSQNEFERGVARLFLANFATGTHQQNKKMLRTINEIMWAGNAMRHRMDLKQGTAFILPIRPLKQLSKRMRIHLEEIKRTLPLFRGPIIFNHLSEATRYMLEGLNQPAVILNFHRPGQLTQENSDSKHLLLNFSRLYVQKMILENFSKTMYFPPFDYIGQDVFFENITLAQLQKVKDGNKVNLLLQPDDNFWPFLIDEFIKRNMGEIQKTISQKDLNLFKFATPQEVVEISNQ